MSTNDTAIPAKPDSLTSRFDPRPTTSTSRPDTSIASATDFRSSIERARTKRSAAPPTLYVVIGASETSGSARSPRTAAARPTASAAAAGIEYLGGKRGDVTAAHRQHDVALSGLSGDEVDELTSVGQPHDPGLRVRLGDGVDDQLARHAGNGRGARGVDVGEHHDVGVLERVRVLLPDLRNPVVAVRLEHRHDTPPVLPAVPSRCQDRRDLRREVCVVVDEGGSSVDSAHVESSSDAAELRQRRPDVVEAEADLER